MELSFCFQSAIRPAGTARTPWPPSGRRTCSNCWKNRRTDAQKIVIFFDGGPRFLFFYQNIGAPWWRFFLLFLWPDLFMVGYLVSVRLGAQLYNLVHTYIFPL